MSSFWSSIHPWAVPPIRKKNKHLWVLWYSCISWLEIWSLIGGLPLYAVRGPDLHWSYNLHQPQVPSKMGHCRRSVCTLWNQPQQEEAPSRLLENELISPTRFSIALILAGRSKTTTAFRRVNFLLENMSYSLIPFGDAPKSPMLTEIITNFYRCKP